MVSDVKYVTLQPQEHQSLQSTEMIATDGLYDANSSSSFNASDPPFSPFVPSIEVQILWTVLFSVMVASAIVGNVVVVMIILCYRQMRTKTNMFLLNLSVADIMMATFNTMFNFIFMLKSHWPFGHTYCVINNFFAMMATASSVFTITATSLDRYMAVVYPLKPRIDHTTSILVVVIIWLLAAMLSLPTLFYSTLYQSSYLNENRTLCLLHWPDGLQNLSQFDHIYNIIVFTVTYVLPMVTMLFTYTRMSSVLWGSSTIGEVTNHQMEAVRSKQKVVPMLITVSIVFGLCWLPYQVYFLVFPYIGSWIGPNIQHVYLAFYWLAMFNSSLNPLIYCLLSKRLALLRKRAVQYENFPSLYMNFKISPIFKATDFPYILSSKE